MSNALLEIDPNELRFPFELAKPISFEPCAGENVEVRSDEDGFQGAWCAATLDENFSNQRPLVKVTYDQFTQDDGSPLTEAVPIAFLRPKPPQTLMGEFDRGFQVEALKLNCWWEGTIIKKLKDGNFLVHFMVKSDDIITFPLEKLRPHLKWNEQHKWELPPKKALIDDFERSGEIVEVKLDGSWTKCVIVCRVLPYKEQFIVKRCELLTEVEETDTNTILVSENNIRAVPEEPEEANLEEPDGAVPEVEIGTEDHLEEATHPQAAPEEEVLPFNKVLSYWKDFEKRKELKGQHPHFGPLAKSHEGKAMLESYAIGVMCGFCDIVKDVEERLADITLEKLEVYRNTICDMHSHGFSVANTLKSIISEIERRLNEEIKEGQEKIKQAHEKINVGQRKLRELGL